MFERLVELVNTTIRPFGIRVERATADADRTAGISLLDVDGSVSAAENEMNRLVNLLSYTKTSGSPYNAAPCEGGYHTIEINGRILAGQRKPTERLKIVPYDFGAKTVLDLGCNQGGMLFALGDQIRAGVGVDYDGRMVNAANRIKASRGNQNLHFYVHDLEKEPLGLIKSFLMQSGVDIVFLLSVCMWIKNWKDVIDFSADIAPAMLFESNGSPEQQHQQEEYLRSRYKDVVLLQSQSPDDPMQTARRLFLCNA